MSFFVPEESESAKKQRADLNAQGGAASGFADQGQAGFAALGNEAAARRDYLRRIASGENSISLEQLRQGMQQGQNAQMSMAASATPQNAAMAARNAANNMSRLGYGMSGQAAVAGMQERRDAEAALAAMTLQQRQQDLNAALGSRVNATSAYGSVTPAPGTPSGLQMAQPFINMAAGGGGALLDYFGRPKQPGVK